MQYCVKCRHISEDGAGKCQNCRSRKLRPAGAGDMAFLCKADMYAAGKVHDALVEAGIEPELVIGVPVGFVNVVQSKEMVLTLEDVPYIVAQGRKGGSNIAACICNALIYQL